mmetsp:Transcript_30410/g.97068  ORF Transcript_30410/g.97068 Transcript_30410/m.97068 type:complete len:156 (+) Transcript_30410:77-544(+)
MLASLSRTASMRGCGLRLARAASFAAESPEEWPVAWVGALNSCDIAAMDALCQPPFTFVVAGKKMELDSMGSLLNFDKMKEMGWRKTTIQDVAVMHGDESQVHVSAILERHMADGAIEKTCSVFFLTKVDEYYRLMVGGNATAGGSTLVSAISGK